MRVRRLLGIEPKRPARLIVHGTFVVSRTDGDHHWIPAAVVARLYDIRPGRNVILVNEDERALLGYRPLSGDRHFYPDPSGRYDASEIYPL